MIIQSGQEYKSKIKDYISVVKRKNRNFFDDNNELRRTQISQDYKDTCAFLRDNQDIIITGADKVNITVASKRNTFINLQHPVGILCGDQRRMENRWWKIIIMLARHTVDTNGGIGDSINVPAIDISE